MTRLSGDRRIVGIVGAGTMGAGIAQLALQAGHEVLLNDVDEAAKYVESLLPEPLRRGSIRAEWRFIPSADLGGDSFGYHPLDDQHFALYLLDVCGHGVGAALLSVSALTIAAKPSASSEAPPTSAPSMSGSASSSAAFSPLTEPP